MPRLPPLFRCGFSRLPRRELKDPNDLSCVLCGSILLYALYNCIRWQCRILTGYVMTSAASSKNRGVRIPESQSSPVVRTIFEPALHVPGVLCFDQGLEELEKRSLFASDELKHADRMLLLSDIHNCSACRNLL